MVAGSFTEDELQNLKDIFDLFDKERQGRIDIKDLEAIMTSLQRDPVEAKALLNQGGIQGEKQSVSFDEFIGLMQQVENKIMQSNSNNPGSEALSSIKKDARQQQHL
jgi:calmodulin